LDVYLENKHHTMFPESNRPLETFYLFLDCWH
jgi:hypothetical protein